MLSGTTKGIGTTSSTEWISHAPLRYGRIFDCKWEYMEVSWVMGVALNHSVCFRIFHEMSWNKPTSELGGSPMETPWKAHLRITRSVIFLWSFCQAAASPRNGTRTRTCPNEAAGQQQLGEIYGHFICLCFFFFLWGVDHPRPEQKPSLANLPKIKSHNWRTHCKPLRSDIASKIFHGCIFFSEHLAVSDLRVPKNVPMSMYLNIPWLTISFPFIPPLVYSNHLTAS